MNGSAGKQNRRNFLRSSLIGSGALLTGFDDLIQLTEFGRDKVESFAGGKILESLEFANESRAPLDSVFGSSLDARLYTDLSAFTAERSVTPTENFYVRTAASEFL